MSVYPIPIDEDSPFFEERCALCQELFAIGDDIVICPEDATRHHVRCWRANDNKCTAFGCSGSGVVLDEEFLARRRPVRGANSPHSQQNAPNQNQIDVETDETPPRHYSCAQSLFLIMVGASILIIALSCFGLWAMFDYLMLEYFELPYRLPFSSWIYFYPLL